MKCAAILCVVFMFFVMPSAVLKKNKNQPKFLKSGDTIAIVAPAGVLKETQNVFAAQKLAESWGLSVVLGTFIFEENGHFAGTDAQRLKDFQNFLDNSSIKAIWCARGGYGSVRIIDKLDFSRFKEKPKWIVGYSDATVFHNHLNNKNIETMHAMMPADLDKDKNPKNFLTLKKALFGESLYYEVKAQAGNITGHVKAPIVGGNLTLLAAMIGSESQLDTKGKIIFLEEVGEYQYHIDRMLRTLDRADFFKNCRAVLVGDMDIKPNDPNFGSSTAAMILEILKPYKIPVAFGLPIGHGYDNWAIPLGRTVDLEINKEKTILSFE